MEVERDKGQLNIARSREDVDVVLEVQDEVVNDGAILTITEGLNDAFRLVYQTQITNVREGDLLLASSVYTAVLDPDNNCNPMINNQLFVTDDVSNDDPEQALFHLTPRNGRKCTSQEPGGRCVFRKVGIAQIPPGAPSRLYVKHVATAHRGCANNGGVNRWRLDSTDEGMNVAVLR